MREARGWLERCVCLVDGTGLELAAGTSALVTVFVTEPLRTPEIAHPKPKEAPP